MKKIYLLFILCAFQSVCQAQKNDIILFYEPKFIEHPSKIVLLDQPQDTITANVVLRYNANNLHNFIFVDSFVNGKIILTKNNRKFFHYTNKIKHLEFIDNNSDLRIFTFNPKLDKENIVEVKSEGKINYFLVYSSKYIVGNYQGFAFIEKDGKWTKHKNWFDKDYLRKLMKLITDQTDLVDRLNSLEFCDSEVFNIIKEYNKRY